MVGDSSVLVMAWEREGGEEERRGGEEEGRG